MNTRTISITLCLLFTLSTHAELTKDDLKEIRQIIKEEISNSEKTTNALIQGLEAKIDGLEEKMDTRIKGVEEKTDTRIKGVEEKIDGLEAKMDTRINGVGEKIDLLTKMIMGLMALTGLAIITPATIVYTSNRREKIREVVESLLSTRDVKAPNKEKA